MAQFEQLQELWQRQAGAVPRRVNGANLATLLQAYGRRQNWVNAIKAALVSSVLAWAVSHVGSSRPAMAGLALVAIVASILLIADWRAQRAIAKRDFAAPSAGFVRDTIERLQAQRDYPRRFAFLIGAIVIGVNLMTFTGRNLWIRLACALLPFGGFELGLYVRRKRWEHDCRPLIEELRAFEASLEERHE